MAAGERAQNVHAGPPVVRRAVVRGASGGRERSRSKERQPRLPLPLRSPLRTSAIACVRSLLTSAGCSLRLSRRNGGASLGSPPVERQPASAGPEAALVPGVPACDRRAPAPDSEDGRLRRGVGEALRSSLHHGKANSRCRCRPRRRGRSLGRAMQALRRRPQSPRPAVLPAPRTPGSGQFPHTRSPPPPPPLGRASCGRR